MVHLIKGFGITSFPLKKLLNAIEDPISSKQSAVRAAALVFYEEWFRWIRDAISPAIQKLKKPQQDELEKLFAKITEANEPRPVPTRLQLKPSDDNNNDADADAEGNNEEEKLELDALDLEEEKDWLGPFDEGWAESLLALK